ncbi:MAG: hypothetical protein N2037_02020 [Acidimicrobiales bacterium]|nr:hypothetical protein [Acidimicrobiales bacterium]
MSNLDEFKSPLAKVTMLLADAAQVADGKLFILGGGLAHIGPQPQPVALALLIEVPWDRANIPHDWKLELLDEDGMPVMANEMPVMVAGQFEAGRPAGHTPGSPLAVPLAINFSPLPVEPGRTYMWRFAINETSESDWSIRFAVRPTQPGL